MSNVRIPRKPRAVKRDPNLAAVLDRRAVEEYERETRLIELRLAQRDRDEAGLPPVARLARRLERDGAFDRTPSQLIRFWRGSVIDPKTGEHEPFHCVIQFLEGSLLLEFDSEQRHDHGRRMVVTAEGGYYLETAPNRWVEVHENKYRDAAGKIVARRCWEKDQEAGHDH